MKITNGINYGKKMHLFEGPVYGRITERKEREKKQHKEGFEPTMSGSQGKRSTIVLQMLPSHALS